MCVAAKISFTHGKIECMLTIIKVQMVSVPIYIVLKSTECEIVM